LELKGDSSGGYFTHIGPSGWYLDAVAMQTWLSGDTVSVQDLGIDLSGDGFTASLEGGYPITIRGNWIFEPQAQAIWQQIDFEDRRDLFSSIDYDDFDGVIGRLGFRLGHEGTGRAKFKPYLLVNLWHNFSTESTVAFNFRPVTTDLDGTTLEAGGGFSAEINSAWSTYATVSYSTDLDDETGLEGIGGTAGLRVRW
jgi:autotransporter family porin